MTFWDCFYIVSILVGFLLLQTFIIGRIAARYFQEMADGWKRLEAFTMQSIVHRDAEIARLEKARDEILALHVKTLRTNQEITELLGDKPKGMKS